MFKEDIETALEEIDELKEEANFCEMIGDSIAAKRLRETVIVKAKRLYIAAHIESFDPELI